MTTSERIDWLKQALVGRRIELQLLAGIVLVSMALKAVWLGADPPRSLEWSIAPFTDESLYSHVARNQVLFGTSALSEWDNRMVSPLFNALAWASFSAFGVGYPQLRIISVILTTIALPFLWSLLREDLGAVPALLGTAALAFDFLWLQYGRLGLLEPGLTAILIFVAWSWRYSLRGRMRYAYASGLALGLAFVWKALALVLVPVPLLATMVCKPAARWRIISAGAAGLLTSGVAYLCLWYLPHRTQIDAYNAFYARDRFPSGFIVAWNALRATMSSRHLLAKSPVLTGTALTALALALRGWWAGRSPPAVVVYSMFWLAIELGLAIMPYSPPRYHLIVLPAVVILASYAVALAQNADRQIMGWSVLGLTIGLGIGRHVLWCAERRYSVAQSAALLTRAVPPESVVIGVPACSLSLATRLKCIPTIDGLTKPGAIARYHPDFAVTDEDNRKDYLRLFEPARLRDQELLGELMMGPRRCNLYRVEK